MFYLLSKRIKQLETQIKKKNENEKMMIQQNKADGKCLKSNVRKPKSKVLHLALQVGLGKEGWHAKGLIR